LELLEALELSGLLVLTKDVFVELFVLLILFEFVIFIELTAFVLLVSFTFKLVVIFVVLAVFVTFVAFVVLFEFVLFVVFVLLLVFVELLEFYDLLLDVLVPDPMFKVELVWLLEVVWFDCEEVVWFYCEELFVVFVALFYGNLVELVEFCEVRFPMKGKFTLSSSGLLFST
jgi:hypothetical protein